jgi:hypothetical protein
MNSQGPVPIKNPSATWRASSNLTMFLTGMISKAFLFGFNRTEVNGLDGFLKILDQRKDIEGRQRGLITGKCALCLPGCFAVGNVARSIFKYLMIPKGSFA